MRLLIDDKTVKIMSDILWSPDPSQSCEMQQFMKYVNDEHELNFDTYEQLYRWSINCGSDFWASIWKYQSPSQCRESRSPFPRWEGLLEFPVIFPMNRTIFHYRNNHLQQKGISV